MKGKTSYPKRKSPRLPGYDYTLEGGYFITIATYNHRIIFGEVNDGEIYLNEVGEIVRKCWKEIPLHYPNVALDEFIIMPSHVHGILFINEEVVGAEHAPPETKIQKRATHASPLQKSIRGSLSTIVASFKSAATRRINRLHNTPGTTVWQRSFYDRIIRDEEELHQLREYIYYNVAKWLEDKENPMHL